MVIQVKPIDASWKALSPNEKLQRRLEAWLSASGIQFVSPQAEANYKARVSRFTHAIQLRKPPDRVPVLASLGYFVGGYYGYTPYDLMYDADKVVEVTMKATQEFQLDEQISPMATRPGKLMEILDDKQYRWPGHGVAMDNDLQFKEDEWMKADEYDAFLDDPSDYRLRTFIPRVMGALEPLSRLSPISNFGSSPASLSAFGLPEVEASLQKLVEAGKAALDWQKKVGPVSRRLTEMGFPRLNGGMTWVPFAHLNDSFRGTRGIMTDIYRQQEKLLEALERITPRILNEYLATVRIGDSPVVQVHVHKGGDGIMSDGQFKTLYWDPLRKMCLRLIEEGLILRFSLEGPFNSRTKLEMFRDLPKGRAIWWSMGGQTDVAQMKDILGDVACIEGDVPAALLQVGTPEEVASYCKHLIDVAGKDGGYIFNTSFIDRSAKKENVWALIKAARQYGIYS